RLAGFFARQFDRGARRVIAVGVDSPTLPLDHIRSALAQIETAHVVLGPATDGGYYLIGTSRHLPRLFADIPWSSADVLRKTIAQVDATLKLALLPMWYDVDVLADWHLLRGHLLALRRAGIDPLAPHTEALAQSSQF